MGMGMSVGMGMSAANQMQKNRTREGGPPGHRELPAQEGEFDSAFFSGEKGECREWQLYNDTKAAGDSKGSRAAG